MLDAGRGALVAIEPCGLATVPHRGDEMLDERYADRQATLLVCGDRRAGSPWTWR